MSRPLPIGTVTFLFSDIEGSTRLLRQLGPAFTGVVERHSGIIEEVVERRQGVVVKTEGDGYFIAFQSALSAVEAAVDIQRALAREQWPSGHQVRVRIGLHTGEGRLGGSDYIGMDVHRAARIADCGHGGQILVSETTARLAEHDLPPETFLEDLGVHELKDLPHPEHLFQVSVAGLPQEFPPLRSLSPVKGNLSQLELDFVGRQGEIEAVAEAVREHRLVTLTGPAGIGKTALARYAAAGISDLFRDGVWFVEVSRVREGHLLAPAIARQLRITESLDEAIEDTLASRLNRSSMLLVLDGCEHLIDTVAKLTDRLLAEASGLRMLVTSREILAIRGERVVVVTPLSIPPSGVRSPAEVGRFDSVALFVSRAQLVQPGFQLTLANAPIVGEICRRLDGIPLAIELAAARLKMLSVQQVVERLDEELSLLSGGSRDLLPHQKTLEGTLDWSFQLLTSSEQALFVRLSVFAGGFTIEAVEEVCAGGKVLPSHVLDLLGRLVDTSLVSRQGVDSVRYRLLEPIAQYARRLLEERGEGDELRERHGAYFLRLAEEAEPQLLGPSQLLWYERLDAERDNLRAALAWFDRSGRADSRIRLAGALRWLWILRRNMREGTEWLERAVAEPGDAAPNHLARALNGVGLLAMRRLDLERASEAFSRALELYQGLGDEAGAARQIYHLATVAWFEDRYEEANRLLTESQALSRRAEDDWTLAWSLAVQGTMARLLGDLDRAEKLLVESHGVFEARGGGIDIGWSFLRLGALARDRGDYREAIERYSAGRARLAAAGDRLGVAHADAGLGAMAWLEGEQDRALARFRDVLEGFGLSEEAAHNLFELKTMIQGNPSTAELKQIVESNRVRAARKEGREGEKRALAEYLLHVGLTGMRQGHDERARRALGESLTLAVEAGDGDGVRLALDALAQLAESRGDVTTSARLREAAGHPEEWAGAVEAVRAPQAGT